MIMPFTDDRLLGWIQHLEANEFLASFVAESTADSRAPATYRCASADEAQRWLEDQAAIIGIPLTLQSAGSPSAVAQASWPSGSAGDWGSPASQGDSAPHP